MTDEMRHKLLQVMMLDVICDFVTITADGRSLYYTNNTEPVMAFSNTYMPAGFDYAPGDPYASESTTSLKISDISRELTELVQSAPQSINVDVFTLSLSDPDSYIDGPEHFTVRSVQITSADNTVTLSLGRESVLNYNASSKTYNNRLFPGLF